MAKDNRPKGRTVCPRVNFRCAAALYRYLSNDACTPADQQIVESFRVNLGKEIKWAQQRDEAFDRRRRETELDECIRAQKEDMAETGHGGVE